MRSVGSHKQVRKGNGRKLVLCLHLNVYSLLTDIVFNPTSVAVSYHARSVAVSITDTQFLIPITFIPLKLGGSPFALTFLGIYSKDYLKN